MHFFGVPIWKKAPFIRVLVPLCFGITNHYWLKPGHNLIICSLVASLILICSFQTLKLKIKFLGRNLKGVSLNLLMFFVGNWLGWFNDKESEIGFIQKNERQNIALLVCVTEVPSYRQNSLTTNITITHTLSSDGELIPASGNLKLYIRLANNSMNIKPGERFFIGKMPTHIPKTGNPGNFDFQNYLNLQHIRYQISINENEILKIDSSNINHLKSFLAVTRETAIKIIRSAIKTQKEAGVAEALLIGYKNDVDKNLLDLYSKVGVIHVIAISGLHLGLIFLILDRLLKVFQINRLPWLHAIIILSFLWLFSLLVGGSPSVVRSAVMFTLIIVGRIISRKSSTLNTLAATAFLLLCYEPFWLFDIGFQLSFAALLGIISFTKAFQRVFYSNFKLVNWVWEALSVTMAAQIFTFPLLVFYFHQFPMLFLFTNLLIVPLSSLILVTELLICAMFFSKTLSTVIGDICSYMIRLMNSIVELSAQLEWSVLDSLNINIAQCFLLFTIIFAIWFSIATKKGSGVIIAFFSILSVATLRLHDFYRMSKQKIIVVFNKPGAQLVDLYIGRSSISKQKISSFADSASCVKLVRNTRVLFRIKSSQKIHAGGFIFKSAKTVFVPDSDLSFSTGITVLVVSNNCIKDIRGFLRKNNPEKIVLDASNSPAYVKKWKILCVDENVDFFNTRESGAFVMRLN